ncbi:uncharacterized protein METZ01_LOCUS92252 [marine metagenome]|uniref:Uncharacterized protein n=1 Tax=marine metagenome TaxID=408172 RepID=A0A381VHZ6_9ZZZZ
MLDLAKRTVLVTGILLMGVAVAKAFTLTDGSSGSLSQTVVNNLGEEYRWNSPVLTYSYDESFLNYFGSNGVVAVEKAIEILNSIPPASSIKTNYPPASSGENNLWNYPTRPDRFHARAYNNRVLDIKSYALAQLFSFMGLGYPEDSAFQLEFGAVALRNWDPISYGPSKYVNGSLLSWVVVGGTNALPFPIDVTKPVRTLAGSSYHRDPRLSEGKYLVAPTRDDIGGYKYLYRKDNFNIEGLPPFTYQMVTNQPDLTNPAIFSVDLRWFSKESKTNVPASFKQFVLTNQWWGPVYTNLNVPPLLVLKTNVNWEMGWTTNVTPYLTNFPWTPVGQPATLVYLTNKYRTFQPSYDYIFGNVITNIHVPREESKVLYRSWEVTPNAPLWSVVGSVPTTTNYTTTILNDDFPHGEIIILPTTNVVGYHFTEMQFEEVNTLTNLLTGTNNLANPGGALPGQGGGLGAGGAAVTNFVGVMEDEVWQSTNHAYLAYPIVLQTNALLIGGIDKVRYVRVQGDSLVTTNYSPSRFLNQYKFPDLEKQTFTYVIPNSAVGLTNAALPSFQYEVDYVDNGVRKTGKFIKFFTSPDIMITALNGPSILTSGYVPPAVVNNNALNGMWTQNLYGPGVIQPSGNMVIGFNKIGIHWDLDPTFFLNEENQAPGWVWGHFDGTTDELMLFPNSQTVLDLEREIYGND